MTEKVKRNVIKILHIVSENQIADACTKSLPAPQFKKLRERMNLL